jgi:hypothetical protein
LVAEPPTALGRPGQAQVVDRAGGSANLASFELLRPLLDKVDDRTGRNIPPRSPEVTGAGRHPAGGCPAGLGQYDLLVVEDETAASRTSSYVG